MSVKKAIKYFIERLIDEHGFPINREHTETAIKALNKADKLIPISYDKHYYRCPFCKENLGIDDDAIYVYKEIPPKYCSHCGQALDWSDTE